MTLILASVDVRLFKTNQMHISASIFKRVVRSYSDCHMAVCVHSGRRLQQSHEPVSKWRHVLLTTVPVYLHLSSGLYRQRVSDDDPGMCLEPLSKRGFMFWHQHDLHLLLPCRLHWQPVSDSYVSHSNLSDTYPSNCITPDIGA